MLQGPPETIARSRTLRKGMSLPEVLLWRELRERPGGFKFRRQHPSGPYVADFFCHEAMLAVEVDGGSHDFGSAAEHDAKRDRWFEANGVAVLRITARDVLTEADAVVRAIVDACRRRTPLHQPAAGPPPPWGEDRSGA